MNIAQFIKHYVMMIIVILTCLKSWSSELKTALKLQGETLNFEILGQKKVGTMIFNE
jgi:hypothetical protein